MLQTLLLMAANWLQPPVEMYRDPSVWFSYKCTSYDRTTWIKVESPTGFNLELHELCGDLNGDGIVNMEDFAILSRQWGS